MNQVAPWAALMALIRPHALGAHQALGYLLPADFDVQYGRCVRRSRTKHRLLTVGACVACATPPMINPGHPNNRKSLTDWRPLSPWRRLWRPDVDRQHPKPRQWLPRATCPHRGTGLPQRLWAKRALGWCRNSPHSSAISACASPYSYPAYSHGLVGTTRS